MRGLWLSGLIAIAKANILVARYERLQKRPIAASMLSVQGSAILSERELSEWRLSAG
jgi:hypothetical protein